MELFNAFLTLTLFILAHIGSVSLTLYFARKVHAAREKRNRIRQAERLLARMKVTDFDRSLLTNDDLLRIARGESVVRVLTERIYGRDNE